MSDELRDAGITNLRNDLWRRQMSQADLARASGLSVHMISQMMCGGRGGSVTSHAKIAEAMGTDPGRYFPRTQLELERAERCQGVMS
jgi:transcriptional regulator with XRE-family HTH domain